MLGLALRQAEPVFASDAQRDPELRYFVAFQDARSILCVPLRAGYDSFGVLVFGSTMPNAFGEEHVELLTAIASQATIALQNASLYQNLLEEKERIIDVEEDARRQLSRDLHDGPTQQVAAIAMRVNYIRRLLERDPEQVPPELQKVEELARQTTKEIRHMLFTLRPLVLETQGLVPALRELAKKLHETHEQNVIIQVQDGLEAYIDTGDESVLFNIVDEAVNNARKHAQAAHIWVRLARQDNYLLLEVEDDGVGFDLGEVDANYDQRGSLGMINLRERSELLNGTLRFESAEGKGTKVSMIAPIRASVLNELENGDTQPLDPPTRPRRMPGSAAISMTAGSPFPLPQLALTRPRRDTRQEISRRAPPTCIVLTLTPMEGQSWITLFTTNANTPSWTCAKATANGCGPTSRSCRTRWTCASSSGSRRWIGPRRARCSTWRAAPAGLAPGCASAARPRSTGSTSRRRCWRSRVTRPSTAA